MNWKSIWAVIAGVLFIIVVTTVLDIVLHVAGVFPAMDKPIDDKLALLATAYRVVISVAGGWVTARPAPAKSVKHALILGGVGGTLGLIGVAATSGKGLRARWYPIPPGVLAGAPAV